MEVARKTIYGGALDELMPPGHDDDDDDGDDDADDNVNMMMIKIKI